jgi:hypothetical protein
MLSQKEKRTPEQTLMAPEKKGIPKQLPKIYTKFVVIDTKNFVSKNWDWATIIWKDMGA